MPHFSQGDARWAARVLGRGSTLQRAGCAISCISMILKHRGRSVDPGTLDEYLDANGGYQGDSVVWGVAAGCGAEGHSRVTYGRFEGAEAQVRAKLEERLAEGRPTMVRVDYGTDDDLRYNHFVLAVGRTADGRILMNDPGTRFGDAYVDAGPDNVIETTSRKRGYRMVQLDWYD